MASIFVKLVSVCMLGFIFINVSFTRMFQTFSFVIDISHIMVFCLYLSTFLPFSRIFLSHSKSLSCHSPLIHNLYRKSDTGMPLCTLSFKRKSNKESKPIMRILWFTSRVQHVKRMYEMKWRIKRDLIFCLKRFTRWLYA